jgi:hypothetical protein
MNTKEVLSQKHSNGSPFALVTGRNGGSTPGHDGEPVLRKGGRLTLESTIDNVAGSTLVGGLAHAFERLRSTKTVEWMLGYTAMASLLIQLIDVLCHLWGWPLAFERAMSLALGLGALPTLVLAWYHGEQGRQRVCTAELALLVTLLGGSVFVVWSLCFDR